MKFKDLVFIKDTVHSDGTKIKGQMLGEFAIVKISKELNIKVSFGASYYSNGIDTYDVLLLGDFTKSLPDDIVLQFGYVTKNEVENIIRDTIDFKLRRKE